MPKCRICEAGVEKNKKYCSFCGNLIGLAIAYNELMDLEKKQISKEGINDE